MLRAATSSKTTAWTIVGDAELLCKLYYGSNHDLFIANLKGILLSVEKYGFSEVAPKPSNSPWRSFSLRSSKLNLTVTQTWGGYKAKIECLSD